MEAATLNSRRNSVGEIPMIGIVIVSDFAFVYGELVVARIKAAGVSRQCSASGAAGKTSGRQTRATNCAYTPAEIHMDFSWYENQRQATIESRGLDFIRAARVFDARRVIHQPSPRHGEDRSKSTIEMDNAFYAVVWMWRGEKTHIISMRGAH